MVVTQLNIPVSVFSGIGLENVFSPWSRPDSPMEGFFSINATEHFGRDDDFSRDRGSDLVMLGQRYLEPPPPTYEEAMRREMPFMT